MHKHTSSLKHAMGDKVVPIRLDDELLRLIDELVELGVYNSRSEALREFIRTGAKRVKTVANAARKLSQLEKDEGEIPVKLEGALKQLLAER